MADQPSARRAERLAQSDFSPTKRATSQQKVGDVDANDEQDEPAAASSTSSGFRMVRTSSSRSRKTLAFQPRMSGSPRPPVWRPPKGRVALDGDTPARKRPTALSTCCPCDSTLGMPAGTSTVTASTAWPARSKSAAHADHRTRRCPTFIVRPTIVESLPSCFARRRALARSRCPFRRADLVRKRRPCVDERRARRKSCS